MVGLFRQSKGLRLFLVALFLWMQPTAFAHAYDHDHCDERDSPANPHCGVCLAQTLSEDDDVGVVPVDVVFSTSYTRQINEQYDDCYAVPTAVIGRFRIRAPPFS